MSRLPSVGIPLTPDCQEGLLKNELAPPPPAAIFAFWLPHCETVQLSFQTFSGRSEEHTSELQSHSDLVCRLLLEKKKLPVQNQVQLDRPPGCAIRADGRYPV